MEQEEVVDEKHYTIAGKKYARVTQIVNFAYPDAFAGIPESKREYYFSRGSNNHKLWEMMDLGTDKDFDFDPEVEKYRAGYERFRRETGFSPLPGGIEMRVKSDELRVAGTLDRLGTMQSRIALVDLKTGTARPTTALQTAIYLILIPGYKFHEVERYGVAVLPNGKYKMSERYPDSDENDARYYIEQYHKSKEAA